jgi:uncharacterized protein (TIGR03086 family)
MRARTGRAGNVPYIRITRDAEMGLIEMDVAELHHRAAEGFRARLPRIRPEDWELPTPCSEWDVRALVQHVAGNHERMAALLHGRPLDVADDDPAGRWTAACAAVRSGLSIPGALDRVGPSPFGGEVPVSRLAAILTADLTTHTWDLARAVGADETLDAAVVAELLPAIERMQPAMAAGDKFAPAIPVPDSAGPQQRLLALFGRQS